MQTFKNRYVCVHINTSIHKHTQMQVLVHVGIYLQLQRRGEVAIKLMGHLITRGQHRLEKCSICERVQFLQRLAPVPLSSVSPPAGEVKSVVWAGQDPQGSGGEDQLPKGGQGTRSACCAGSQSITPSRCSSRSQSVCWVNRQNVWSLEEVLQ